MSVHFLSTRASVSKPRTVTICSARGPSSRRRQSTKNSALATNNAPVHRRQSWGADVCCLSTTANQQRHKFEQKYSSREQYDSLFTKKVLAGLSTAAVAGVGISNLDNRARDQQLSLCESASSTKPFYQNFGENLKILFYENKQSNETSAPVGADGLFYEPSPAASTTIPGRMIGVVKASVDTATEWEKKAKETVRMMTHPYPKSYDVSV